MNNILKNNKLVVHKAENGLKCVETFRKLNQKWILKCQ